MALDILFILLGLLLLVKGGDWLVDGSVTIARRLKLSSMVIGLTVIGFGTSMPELLVSIQAAWADNSGIAIGNVVGSNISNIALILGASALIRPLPVTRSTLIIDMPFMVLACILMFGLGMSGSIDRIPGLMLFALLVAFVSWQVAHSRKVTKAAMASQSEAEAEAAQAGSLPKALLLVAVSFTLLVVGARMLVDSGSDIARMLGVSDRIIGLTIVAVGTSLPELFASIMAAHKGETDMAVGNIIGSVSFNILSVIGLSAAICPISDSDVDFLPDYLLMVGLSLLLWFFSRTKYTLERWEGSLLLLIYVAYLLNLVVSA